MTRETIIRERVYDYRITAQGNWICQGNPVNDPDLACLLSRSLSADPKGGFLVRCQGEVHPVRVEDAPLRVDGLEIRTDTQGRPVRVELILADGRVFGLSDNLTVSDSNRLYLTLMELGLEALFSRRAYYELTRYMDQDNHGYYIPLAGERFYIKARKVKSD